ncbi:X-Pro dipeptidyl-peptidase C-terminal non-catalytic domain-containing protein [Phaeosphaeriaceae sp. PMI808]|nr:X-Pro dipeptidyl-peptidase C-terminal non-catalytic domain-containing protein [Phaeosphaeriaceae sp. PMI808]
MCQTPPFKDFRQVFTDEENQLVFEKNVSVPMGDEFPVRCNVYRPIAPGDARFPVLVTYGPYGKDIPYSDFLESSFKEVNPEHRSKYSAWETPEPTYWTKEGYAIVRADERGTGQSPGHLNIASAETSRCFAKLIEWVAVQPWSSGKIGLLGISYYATSQWGVAALRPKGLAAMIPWEGTSDHYREWSRHGGILSNTFYQLWWNRQIGPNQYGKPGRAAASWGEDTIDGDITEDELKANRTQRQDETSRFSNDEYYAGRTVKLDKIEVPVLSVANLGGNLLHLRGNVEGYTWAGSKLKYLRFIVGRHDLPIYYHDEVEVQKSFLDAFLKGEDKSGWSIPGKLRQDESAWPIPRTQYTRYHLNNDGTLGATRSGANGKKSYKALGSLEDSSLVQFETTPFEKETEITGHIVGHLNVSVTPDHPATENDIDVFLTIRHLNAQGNEVFYTGSMGDAVPVVKGWLRLSLRKVDESNAKHRPYLPHRNYSKGEVQAIESDKVYSVDVEFWPTSVVVGKGGKLICEISSGDTQGVGIFRHNSEVDRPQDKFAGMNHIHFGEQFENYITLPIIP